MRPVVAALRAPVLLRLPVGWPITQLAGATCSIYLDDLLLLLLRGECHTQVISAVLDLYGRLGLLFKDSKSVLVPSAVVRHLGFDVNAVNHRISLPDDKILAIASRCHQLLS